MVARLFYEHYDDIPFYWNADDTWLDAMHTCNDRLPCILISQHFAGIMLHVKVPIYVHVSIAAGERKTF